MQTHGQISYHPNPSPTLAAKHRNNTITERFLIRTPPGYDEGTGGVYPVLYLLHGVGDVEFSWEVQGRVSAILDDLQKDKLIPPMIVVMPFGFECQKQKLDRDFPATQWFDGYLKALIRVVETEYRIKVESWRDDSVKRAIAGLSMGGKQALEFGLDNLDLVSAIGNFSGAIQDRRGLNPLPVLQAACQKRSVQLKNIACFYHGCGGKDQINGLLDANRALVADLRRLGISHKWHEMPGDHSWGVWKACLREFLTGVASVWQ
jgi:enterochelin esterase-like enzyme